MLVAGLGGFMVLARLCQCLLVGPDEVYLAALMAEMRHCRPEQLGSYLHQSLTVLMKLPHGFYGGVVLQLRLRCCSSPVRLACSLMGIRV